MKINNVIIDEGVKEEMKWFRENVNEELEDRWFSWSNVFEGINDFEFKKGLFYVWLSWDRMGFVEEFEVDNVEERVKEEEEEWGKRFYEDDKVVLINGEDGMMVWVK
jgi:hypothetical protein